jgi:hypothetical protein
LGEKTVVRAEKSRNGARRLAGFEVVAEDLAGAVAG